MDIKRQKNDSHWNKASVSPIINSPHKVIDIEEKGNTVNSSLPIPKKEDRVLEPKPKKVHGGWGKEMHPDLVAYYDAARTSSTQKNEPKPTPLTQWDKEQKNNPHYNKANSSSIINSPQK